MLTFAITLTILFSLSFILHFWMFTATIKERIKRDNNGLVIFTLVFLLYNGCKLGLLIWLWLWVLL